MVMNMRAKSRILLKIAGLGLGAATLLQAGGSCNVQFPPDNTDCLRYMGVCIALPNSNPNAAKIATIGELLE